MAPFKNSLVRAHIAACLLHTAQLVASVVVIATNAQIRRFYREIRISSVGAQHALDHTDIFRVYPCTLIPVYFGLTALAHLIYTQTKQNETYIYMLKTLRWTEYAATATLMIVCFAILSGVLELGTLVCIAFLNVAVMVCGYDMDHENYGYVTTVFWGPYIKGLVLAVPIWIAVFAAFFNAARVPPMVYGAVISYFVLFNTFAMNMFMEYKHQFISHWQAERNYIVLSLVSKSLVGWLVLGGMLQDE